MEARASQAVVDAMSNVTLGDVPRSIENFARRCATRDGEGSIVRADGGRPSNGQRAILRAVSHLRLRSADDYAVCAFMLDCGQSIPLHNHPDMCVHMRVLFGRAHVRAFDFVHDNVQSELSTKEAMAGNGRRHQARLVFDETVCESGRSGAFTLEPRRCNVHEIRAVTPCAILEVQTPPYAVDGGRDCHYFEEVEQASATKFLLREIGCPDTFECVRFNRHGEFDEYT